jgi:hypothetical protein
MTGPYTPRKDGQLSPEKPPCCPKRGEDGLACRIVVKEWRDRKTGPGHKLISYECVVHGTIFTLYPTGWWPYGRVGMGEACPNLHDAVADAVVNRLWPTEGHGHHGCRKTQHRRITLSLQILGVDPVMLERDRVSAALELGIPTVKLISLANQARAGPTLAGRALVVIEATKLRPSHSVPALLRRGATLGRWPTPLITQRG